MNVLDLFSGIGGFSLGLERAGMKTIAFCEIEEFPRKVLKKHWPDVPIYKDVRNVTKERLQADGVPRIDIITGGFPCQDLSDAGKRAGIFGEKSGLWGELFRIMCEIRPKYTIFENVAALLTGDNGGWFERLLSDLAEGGFILEWECIPASSVGAPHRRDRIYGVAYPREGGWKRIYSNAQFKKTTDMGNNNKPNNSTARDFFWATGETELERKIKRDALCKPLISRRDDGLSVGVDRLKSLGNSIIPQIPEVIGRAIMEIEARHQPQPNEWGN